MTTSLGSGACLSEVGTSRQPDLLHQASLHVTQWTERVTVRACHRATRTAVDVRTAPRPSSTPVVPR